MPDLSRPLDNFPLVRSTTIDAVCDALARVYVRPNLKITRGPKVINATMNECALQDVQLGYGTYGGDVELEYPAAGRFLLLLPARGQGQITAGKTGITLGPGTSAMISPEIGFKASYAQNYEFFVLKIDRQALTRKLLALTGATINEPLRMAPQIIAARPEAKLLHEYLPVLANTLSASVGPMPTWWVAQTEQLLATMLLFSHQHNYSHLLEEIPADAAPLQVRRAEEYIEANPQRPITMEDLAAVSGVSVFSLFRAFKRSRGYSPLEFAAQVRLRQRGAQG